MNDLRHAFRQLRKSPGFTVVAVLTLALAIGANTAIFSVVDGVLLRPAPFEQVERLMMVWETDRKSGTVREPASLPDYLDLRERSRTFEELAGFSAGSVTLTGMPGDPARLPAIASTSEFLPLLRIDPVLGRTFTAHETSSGGDTGLLLKSFWQIQQVDPGFRAEGVLKAEFQLPASRYPVDFSVWPNLEEMHRFNAALLDRVQGLPGVESAAITIAHPMDRGYTNSFAIVGREAESADLPEISIRSVSPGYFDTVRLVLRNGRAFGSGDGTNAPAVAVINEESAKLIFPERDPIGQSISFWGTERRIIGVVANEKFHGLTAPAPMAVYTPIAQTPSISGAEALLVRTGGNVEVPGSLLRAAILEIDPQLAVFGVGALDNTLGRTVAQQRFTMLLLGLFAAVAIALAVIGIHGVLNYIVSRRTSEMGIRIALGASRADVVGLVARHTAKLAITGLVLGLAAALASTKLLSSLLFGVTATDPATLVAVVILVVAVSILATLLPARRATSIQPIEALRHE